MAGQIKSKERVADHGEVFTNEREVNAMLDMVKPETERTVTVRFTAGGEKTLGFPYAFTMGLVEKIK